jgi:uncharacterized protein YraI
MILEQTDTTTLHSSPLTSHRDLHSSRIETRPSRPARRRPLWVWLSLMVFLVFVLSACGPSRSNNDSALLTTQTRQIAENYRASGNLEGARASLSALNVANANQWLVLVAEEAIAQGESETADALTELVLDLGLNSSVINRYASARGLNRQASAPVAEQPTPTRARPAAPVVQEPEPQAEEAGNAPASETETEAASPTEEVETPPSEPTVVQLSPVTSQPAQVQALSPMNVRGGPGTNHPIIGALQSGNSAAIIAKDNSGDWWQITLAGGATGWIYGALVETSGDLDAIAVAQVIPTVPPATATPVPQAAATPVPAQSEPAPAEPAPAQPAPPAAAPAPSNGPHFQLVEQRLWDVVENGGFLAGDSVNCGEKQVLRVIVEDANGSPLNGVTIRGVFRNEIHVTGVKGEGVAELDMNKDGDDIEVLRDVDGREASSDRAGGNTARTWDIPYSQLIQGRFCKDDASCQAFVGTNGCFGHFSWTVRFRRNY